VGTNISLDELKQRYDAVILASGAEYDRELGLKSENKFIHGAREFVAWYNGHPDVTEEVSSRFERLVQNAESCVLVGNGNVALDCARVLLTDIDELKATDIADRALEALSRRRIKSVSVVGRRGHPQASFTMKELRELTKLKDVAFRVDKEELDRGGGTKASKQEIATQRPTKRMDALLRENLTSKEGCPREIKLRFLLAPDSIITENDTLKALRFERTRLSGNAGHQKADLTGEYEDIPCQMALRSVGYKAQPLEPSLPFDHRKGVVITKDGGRVEPGVYAVGWLKRGPTGIIGTNIPDAHETVDVIVRDMPTFDLNRKHKSDDLESLLRAKGIKFVDWSGYKKIEQAEEARGIRSSPPRPRVKFTSVADMLRASETT
jgi:NADPH-dependent glutamate synthase beta subunit-like oxidoreductase